MSRSGWWSGSTTTRRISTSTCLVQRLKLHPLFRPHLEGGQLLEWGAKTIPEGGYYSLPGRRSGDGVLIVGDAAGFVDVPSLKGIHYAMQSGMYAARTAFAALKAGDTSAAGLSAYDRTGGRAASSPRISTARATCGWPSRTGSSWAGSRRG